MGIGNNIRRMRTELGWKQSELAAKIGVTAAAVGNYEQEVSFPKAETLYRLMKAFNCTADSLLGEDNALTEHIEMYRMLDEEGKNTVNECTRRELFRCTGKLIPFHSGSSSEISIAARKGADSFSPDKQGNILKSPDYGRGNR